MQDLLSYTFMQHALLGSILTGVVCGLVGAYIVMRRMVFIAGGMAHAALGGVGVCALLGWPVMVGATAFALLTGYSVQALSRQREVREDSAIAMLWAFGMGVGILCTYLSPQFLPSLPSFLFGNILYINAGDLWFQGALALVATVVFVLFSPHIVAVSFDRDFAVSQGLPVRQIETLMMTLVGLCLVASLHTAGIVLVISLLSIPQLTANLLSQRFTGFCLWSVAISVTSCLAGLAASCAWNVPSGACIVLASITIYVLVRTIKRAFACFINK